MNKGIYGVFLRAAYLGDLQGSGLSAVASAVDTLDRVQVTGVCWV
jgi:hypothetical protein